MLVDLDETLKYTKAHAGYDGLRKSYNDSQDLQAYFTKLHNSSSRQEAAKKRVGHIGNSWSSIPSLPVNTLGDMVYGVLLIVVDNGASASPDRL